MKRLLKDSVLESGNYLLMCYQDVLKALNDIKKGKDKPVWFNRRLGSCLNVELVSEIAYGVNPDRFDNMQRYVVDPSISYAMCESKLDYILNQLWIESLELPCSFADIYSSKTFPIAREFPSIGSVQSYTESANIDSMYKGNQLDARIALMEFKCKILSDELKYIWENFGKGQTTKDFKFVFED